MPDWILHLDLDQFVAAVEIRRRPELRGRPVVVGGSGDPTAARQVVATASYEARAFGVHSGMPLRAAARRCADAVFLPTDPPAYDAASAEVMAVVREFPVVVEVWGWDEAYIGATTDDPERLAADIRAAVLERTGLSAAVGVGDSKQQAKLAAQSAKPGGIGRLTDATWAATMHPRPVQDLVGIGQRTAARLAGLGIATVGELASADPAVLGAALGPSTGPWLILQARGGVDRSVSAEPWVARSVSRERTYATDLTDAGAVRAALDELSARVADDVAADGRAVVRVAVKLRTSSFRTSTRAVVLPVTREPSAIAAAARLVLERFDVDRPVRLLGVRAEFSRTDRAEDGPPEVVRPASAPVD